MAQRWSLVTLRITVQNETVPARLKLEGRIAGPFANELARTWRALTESLESKRLCVDLCDVTYIDSTGRQVLAEIHKETGAEFVANSPFIKYFAEEARRGNFGNGH